MIYTVSNLNCRICMQVKDKMKKIPECYLNGLNYGMVFKLCNGFDMKEHLQMNPTHICGECEEGLIQMYIFRKKCQLSEELLTFIHTLKRKNGYNDINIKVDLFNEETGEYTFEYNAKANYCGDEEIETGVPGAVSETLTNYLETFSADLDIDSLDEDNFKPNKSDDIMITGKSYCGIDENDPCTTDTILDRPVEFMITSMNMDELVESEPLQSSEYDEIDNLLNPVLVQKVNDDAYSKLNDDNNNESYQILNLGSTEYKNYTSDGFGINLNEILETENSGNVEFLKYPDTASTYEVNDNINIRTPIVNDIMSYENSTSEEHLQYPTICDVAQRETNNYNIFEQSGDIQNLGTSSSVEFQTYPDPASGQQTNYIINCQLPNIVREIIGTENCQIVEIPDVADINSISQSDTELYSEQQDFVGYLEYLDSNTVNQKVNIIEAEQPNENLVAIIDNGEKIQEKIRTVDIVEAKTADKATTENSFEDIKEKKEPVTQDGDTNKTIQEEEKTPVDQIKDSSDNRESPNIVEFQKFISQKYPKKKKSSRISIECDTKSNNEIILENIPSSESSLNHNGKINVGSENVEADSSKPNITVKSAVETSQEKTNLIKKFKIIKPEGNTKGEERHSPVSKGGANILNSQVPNASSKNIAPEKATENRRKSTRKVTKKKEHKTATSKIKTNGKGQSLCPECGKIVINLNLHRQYHADVKEDEKHACDLCGKKYKRSYELLRHKRTHNDDKRYECKHCGEKFVLWLSRRNHMDREHTGERRYECKICKEKFLTSNSYYRHLRGHTGEKPHKCKICNIRFTSKKSLDHHMPTHSDAKDFICEFCSKGFSRQKSLKVHLRIHNNEKNYICEVCSMSFIQNHLLRTHVTKLHPEFKLPPPGTIVSLSALKKIKKGVAITRNISSN